MFLAQKFGLRLDADGYAETECVCGGGGGIIPHKSQLA